MRVKHSGYPGIRLVRQRFIDADRAVIRGYPHPGPVRYALRGCAHNRPLFPAMAVNEFDKRSGGQRVHPDSLRDVIGQRFCVYECVRYRNIAGQWRIPVNENLPSGAAVDDYRQIRRGILIIWV